MIDSANSELDVGDVYEVKVPLAVTAWLAGVIGFSVKEALGGQTPRMRCTKQRGFLVVRKPARVALRLIHTS